MSDVLLARSSNNFLMNYLKSFEFVAWLLWLIQV